MKKILVFALMCAFTVSAFAVEFDFAGEHQLTGYMQNNLEVAEKDTKTTSYYYQYANILGTAQLDPKTTFNFLAEISDGNLGDTSRLGAFTQVWATYGLLEGLTLTVGRTDGADYFRGFHSYSDTVDLLRADYIVSDAMSFYAVTEKWAESGSVTGEADSYVAGADLVFGDLGIYPVLTYYHINGEENWINGGITAEYLPTSGLNVKGAVFAESQTKDIAGGKYTLFGGYLDASWVMPDAATVGVLVAYGSEDEDAGVAFGFGNDWAKTTIIDDNFADGSGDVAGMLEILAYADCMPVTDLTLSVIGGVYMSMLSENNNQWFFGPHDETTNDGLYATDDTFAFEVDVYATYQLTELTYVQAGFAYAQASDVVSVSGGNAGAKYDSDPIMQAWWTLYTEF